VPRGHVQVNSDTPRVRRLSLSRYPQHSIIPPAKLRQQQRICLLTLPRRNQKQQLPPGVAQAINSARQIIETVNGQLAEQFHVETNHAHTFWGLCTRLLGKLTAHTLCIYLNRLLGNPQWLRIKALAFPI